MKWPTMCVDNFFDNVDEIIQASTKLKFYVDEDGRWPGKRTNNLQIEDSSLASFINLKILRLVVPHFKNQLMYGASSGFQRIDDSYGKEGWIHQDNDTELSAIIYLSDSKNCGTSIFKPKNYKSFFKHNDLKKHYLKNKQFDQKYYESLQENNSQFDETIYFESVKNRLLLFDGNQVHGVKNLIDPNNKTRLTYVAFFKFIMDPSLKSFVVESKRQLVG
tara:strand:+ start:865 stop:1521 length:657 start_codon:yes stop_codon:yes gene_type:complete